MLQIISGKFFTSDDRERHPGKGITYSNYSWIGPITTSIASIEPVYFSSSNVTPYVISYLNQVEKDGLLIRVGDPEIVHQFQLLCIFGLRAYFNVDRDKVDVNCREVPKTSNDNFLPSKFTTRFFEPKINGKQEEIAEFIRLVNHTIGLPRKTYEIVMTCMENFTNSLQSINYNLDLAYSMMIYSLEALSQSFDGYRPTWEDYDQSIAKRLEAEFCNLESNIAENIKQILLQSSHQKLQKRFIDFVINHVKDSYFLEEAKEQTGAIKKSELLRALKNAYNMRSKYVHELQQIPHQMHHPHIGKGDLFYWGNDVYFTYNGLTRLAYHVIKKFILDQAIIETEKFDWRRNLPGVITLNLSPEYWVWKHEDFTPDQVFSRLSGFLEQVQAFLTNRKELSNLSNLVEKLEGFIKNSKVQENQKHAMVCIILLFLSAFDRNQFHAKCQQYRKYLEVYTIEKMILDILLAGSLSGNVTSCETEYKKYLKNKFSKCSFRIPDLIELCIIVDLANRFLQENNIFKYQEWMNFAILEAAGNNKLQIQLADELKRNSAFNIQLILKTRDDAIDIENNKQ